jgi:hypothetical protein
MHAVTVHPAPLLRTCTWWGSSSLPGFSARWHPNPWNTFSPALTFLLNFVSFCAEDTRIFMWEAQGSFQRISPSKTTSKGCVWCLQSPGCFAWWLCSDRWFDWLYSLVFTQMFGTTWQEKHLRTALLSVLRMIWEYAENQITEIYSSVAFLFTIKPNHYSRFTEHTTIFLLMGILPRLHNPLQGCSPHSSLISTPA